MRSHKQEQIDRRRKLSGPTHQSLILQQSLKKLRQMPTASQCGRDVMCPITLKCCVGRQGAWRMKADLCLSVFVFGMSFSAGAAAFSRATLVTAFAIVAALVHIYL